MSYCLAVFSSITYANRIKKILDGKIGYAALMHAPSTLSTKGCAYCLRFRKKHLDEVIKVTENSNIAVKGFFEETPNGYRNISP